MKEKMENKNVLFSAMFLLVILSIGIGMVSAATTMNSPVASGNYTGTLNVSVTVDQNGAFNMTNVTCFYNSSGGLATTFLVAIANTSKSSLVFENGSIDISSFTETSTWNISCDVRNGTGANSLNQTISVASVTIDSTAPLCTLTGDHKTIPWKGIIQLDWTSSDAVSLVSTSTTIDGPQDQTTITDTDTSDSRTLTSQETAYWGDWTVTTTATDRPGNTATCTYEFSSYLPDDVSGEGEVTPKAPLNTGTIVIGLLIIGAIAYFVMKKK